MRVDFIEPFAGAAAAVLKDVLDIQVDRGDLSLEKGIKAKEGFLVTFGLSGDFVGTVLFNVSEKTAIDIAGCMNGEGYDSMEEMVMDSMAELMNIIIGKSVTELNDMGFEFFLTPPTICCGKDMKITMLDLESLVVPVKTPYGDFSVSVAIREAA